MSDQVNELFAALSKMQAQLSNVGKSKNGHNYKYADLASCIEMARKPMTDNGLSVTQLIGDSERGLTITTILGHLSGQYLMSTFVMPEAVLSGSGSRNPVQRVGSAITYTRRYAFAAIIGLAQEDDDGSAVVNQGNYQCQQQQQPYTQPVQYQQPQKQEQAQQVHEKEVIDAKDIREFHAALEGHDDIKEFIKDRAGIDSIKDMPKSRFEGCIKWVKTEVAKRKSNEN